MRLHLLELTGVGPFRDAQRIDFDALTESGLFLIEGPTGAGKTTIIDAIVYALFGTVSGGAASDANRIRSSFCTEDDPTGVTLEFSVDGRRHRMHRVPARVRDPLEPDTRAKSKPARQTLRELAADGSDRLVLTRQEEIASTIESLLGMTAEQFRHLVVLPQGQFAELLRKTPMERMTALAPLLGEDYFGRLQEQLRSSGDAAALLRRDADDSVQQAAHRLAGRLSGVLPKDDDTALPFTDAELPDAERMTALADILATLGDDAARAIAARDALRPVVDDARREATSAAELARALAGASQAAHALARAESGLHEQDRDLTSEAMAARISVLTRSEGSLIDLAAWEEAEPTRSAERAALAEAFEQAHDIAEQLRTARTALPGERAALEERLASLRLLTAVRETAARDEERLSVLAEATTTLHGVLPDLEVAAAELAAAEAAEADSEAAAGQALVSWQHLTTRQGQQLAARLASQLTATQACPVCGSLDHPSPALHDDSAFVSDAEIDAAAAAAGAAREAVTASRQTTMHARARWQGTQTTVAELTGAIGSATSADIESELVQARDLRARAESAGADLSHVTELLRDVDRRASELDSAITDAETHASVANGRHQAVTAEHERQALALHAAIGEAPSAKALLAETRDRIAALGQAQQARTDQAVALAGVPTSSQTTTLAEAEAAMNVAVLELQAAESALRGSSERAVTLADASREAVPLAVGLRQALEARTSVIETTADAIALGALVTASSTTNSRRLQLRSYALQRRFESVLTAASGHLERMSGGKFAFELDDHAAGSGQSGLGIAVLDTWTGHRQDPKSLSGGESFYASLALALGLADIVRSEAGGSALETLFVDEGFGSLDQDTLYLVLDQLEGLRSGGRAVGVVSHVTEMKESIPDRIEVRRRPDRTSEASVPRNDEAS